MRFSLLLQGVNFRAYVDVIHFLRRGSVPIVQELYIRGVRMMRATCETLGTMSLPSEFRAVCKASPASIRFSSCSA